MFIELLDLLRCINAHEETWLVASLKAISNRFVLDGTLGCPVCHAEYPIRKGVADFSRADQMGRQSFDNHPQGEKREELATRVGAFLNATEPGATLVLGGSWAEAAQELSRVYVHMRGHEVSMRSEGTSRSHLLLFLGGGRR